MGSIGHHMICVMIVIALGVIWLCLGNLVVMVLNASY